MALARCRATTCSLTGWLEACHPSSHRSSAVHNVSERHKWKCRGLKMLSNSSAPWPHKSSQFHCLGIPGPTIMPTGYLSKALRRSPAASRMAWVTAIPLLMPVFPLLLFLPATSLPVQQTTATRSTYLSAPASAGLLFHRSSRFLVRVAAVAPPCAVMSIMPCIEV